MGDLGISQFICPCTYIPPRPALVTQLDACPGGDQEVAGSNYTRSATFFMETDPEMFSLVILSPLLISRRAVVSF